MPKGSCLCHKLEYEYTGNPLTKATCHCLSCRKISGGTHTVNLLLPEANMRITSGSAKQFTEIHENGQELKVNFCAECGCAVYKTHGSFPGCVVVLAGTLDEGMDLEECKPEAELWGRHRVSWVVGVEGAAQKLEF